MPQVGYIIPSLVVGFILGFIIFRVAQSRRKTAPDLTSVSGNVIFYIDGYIYSRDAGFCNLSVDGTEPIQVYSGTPIGLDLEPDKYTIFVTYPRHGDEVYPAARLIEVAPGTRYQIIYRFPSTKYAPAEISVQTID